jgi:hypothetical protein
VGLNKPANKSAKVATTDAHQLLLGFLWALENSSNQMVQLMDPPNNNKVDTKMEIKGSTT